MNERSGPANWRIEAHAHHDLSHIIFLETGGGIAEADGAALSFLAPCILVVPAGTVHGFTWQTKTDGRVLTFSDAFLSVIAAREPALSGLFSGGLWTAPASGADVAGPLARLERELGWVAAGNELAIEAYVSVVLIEALRLRQQIDEEQIAAPGQQAMLVARFRALMEARFREHPGVEWCAAALGASPARLRAACREIAGASPAQLQQERIMVEAERIMRYSDMTIAQIAYYLGFEDPAYFSRFFARHAGAPPRLFRNAVRAPRKRSQ